MGDFSLMNYSIEATKREQLGRQAKTLRNEMKIPAVLYGNKVDPQPITVARTPFIKLLNTAGYSSLIDVKINGGEAVKAVLKDVQVHPISMDPIHADFYQVDMSKEMEATVPLEFMGESKAVKQEGGTLVTTIDEVDIRCLPGDLPAKIDVDLSVLNTFEDAITVNDLKLPEGVEVLTDEQLTIANVARPLTEEELKALEESQVGDVSEVAVEGAEAGEGGEGEAAADGEEKKEEASVRSRFCIPFCRERHATRSLSLKRILRCRSRRMCACVIWMGHSFRLENMISLHLPSWSKITRMHGRYRVCRKRRW